MNLWTPIEDLRAGCNLSSLTASARDAELILYARGAQKFAEAYCKRYFDGLISRTTYHNGSEVKDCIQLRTVPLISVTSIKDDILRGFDSTTLVDSTSYFLVKELGQIQRKTGRFNSAERNLQVISYGGYVAGQDLISPALAADNMTISSTNLAKFSGQAFSLWVQTATAQAAGNVVITGLDENGVAQTETIAFTGTAASRKMSDKQWTSVTDFDALAIIGAASTGTVRLHANSFPEDLRVAIEMHVAHLFLQDNQQSINTGSRSLEQASESNYVHEAPKEVIQILNGYRDSL